MKKITQDTKIVVGPITNFNMFRMVFSVLKAHAVITTDFDEDGLNKTRIIPQGIRIHDMRTSWSGRHSYYLNKFYDNYEQMDVQEFLNEYQVPLEYRGYEGSYEYENDDRCWYGKIINTTDLIMYEGRTLTEIQTNFVTAVNDYIKDLEEIKEQDMNTKQLRWKIELEDSQPTFGYYIVDGNGNYLLKNGPGSCRVVGALNLSGEGHSSIYFTHKHDAEEFIEEMIEECPDIMYVRPPVTFVDDDTAVEILAAYYDQFVSTIVEQLMIEDYNFSRHDVLKTIRQLLGPNTEVKYSEWKPLIVEAVESFAPMYGYEEEFVAGHFIYSQAEEIEEEDDDDDIEDEDPISIAGIEISDSGSTMTITNNSGQKMVYTLSEPYKTETVQLSDATVNSADTVVIDADTAGSVVAKITQQNNAPAPADNTEPARVSNRHTLSADFVRAAGGYPGAQMDIIICKHGIFVNESEVDNLVDWKNSGGTNILLHTTMKVDKNCNLRISKYMFDLADMGQWFGDKDLESKFRVN